jgi:hypothetical protein
VADGDISLALTWSIEQGGILPATEGVDMHIAIKCFEGSHILVQLVFSRVLMTQEPLS